MGFLLFILIILIIVYLIIPFVLLARMGQLRVHLENLERALRAFDGRLDRAATAAGPREMPAPPPAEPEPTPSAPPRAAPAATPPDIVRDRYVTEPPQPAAPEPPATLEPTIAEPPPAAAEPPAPEPQAAIPEERADDAAPAATAVPAGPRRRRGASAIAAERSRLLRPGEALRHAMGRLGRRHRARARRHPAGALLDRAGPVRARPAGDRRRGAGARAGRARRAGAPARDHRRARRDAAGAHPEHSHRRRHHRRLRRRLGRLRALRLPLAGARLPAARRGGAGDLGGRAGARAGARRARPRRRLCDAAAGLHRAAELLGALRLPRGGHRRRLCAGALPDVGLAGDHRRRLLDRCGCSSASATPAAARCRRTPSTSRPASRWRRSSSSPDCSTDRPPSAAASSR